MVSVFVKGTWRTKDGREYLIRMMDITHLENTIRYLETRGVSRGLMTAEERAQDPVAEAEFLLCDVSEFLVDKYKELLAERDRRKKEQAAVCAAMARTRPGAVESIAPPIAVTTPISKETYCAESNEDQEG